MWFRFARSLCPLLLLASPLRIAAQDPACDLSLTGRAIDQHDHQPLAFAEVFIPALGRGTVADMEGRYLLEGLCPGEYIVRVQHLGCEPVERKVTLRSSTTMDFQLEHHVEELRAFEVAQERPDENVGQAHTELDRDQIERNAGRTLAELLGQLPGVTMLSSGPTIGKPVIHGLSGNRILTLNQGIRQEDQQWGTEHAPSLDPLTSDRITVVKGAASVQYGSDALGGVIITEPVELPREAGLSGEMGAMGQYNGRGGGGHGSLQGGIQGLPGVGWRVQASGRYLGDSEAPDYVLSNTGVREAGGSAAVGYRDHRWSTSLYYSYFGRELGILRASHIGNLTDLNNAITSGTPWYVADATHAIEAPRQEMQHHLLKAEAGVVINEHDRILLTYGYQADRRREYDIRRGGRSDIPALDLFLATHTADGVWKHWLGKWVHGKVGVSGVIQENSNIPGTGVRPLIPDYAKESVGIFLVEHIPLSPRVELEAGGRLERTHLSVSRYDEDGLLVRPVHDFRNRAVSLGVNWTVTDSVRLRFNVGRAYRPPQVSELYSEGLHHGAAAIEVGNDQLASERSWMATGDLEASWFGGRLRTDLTLYAHRIPDSYIYLQPDGVGLTVRGAFPVFRYVAADALLYGLDASLQFRVARCWSLRSRMSTVHGREPYRDQWLFLMPSDRIENAILFTLPELAGWQGVEITATSLVVLEQQRIPPGMDYTDPPGTYHLLGLSFSAARALRANELRVGIQVTNLFDTSYRDYLDRFRYYADARGIDTVLWVRYAFGRSTSS